MKYIFLTKCLKNGGYEDGRVAAVDGAGAEAAEAAAAEDGAASAVLAALIPSWAVQAREAAALARDSAVACSSATAWVYILHNMEGLRVMVMIVVERHGHDHVRRS